MVYHHGLYATLRRHYLRYTSDSLILYALPTRGKIRPIIPAGAAQVIQETKAATSGTLFYRFLGRVTSMVLLVLPLMFELNIKHQVGLDSNMTFDVSTLAFSDPSKK